MAADDTTPRAEDGDLTRTGGQAAQLIAAVGPPLTVATAMLFYFGWVRTSVEAATLGVSDAVFGYTTQDYVMRSINALFLPVVVAAALAIGVLLLHGWLVRGIGSGPPRRRHRVARGLGTAVLPACVLAPAIAGMVEAARPSLTGLVLPLGIAVGLLLTAYGVTLRRRTDRNAHLWETPAERRRGLRIRVLVGIVVAAALFWWVGDFAAVVGRGLAYRIAGDIDQLPGVVVYSEKDLQIRSPGVRAGRLVGVDGAVTAYAFRYDGLRLLEHVSGRLFLLPDGWTIDSGTMVVIPDDDRIRVEYTHDAG
jgi:hypothetical protein